LYLQSPDDYYDDEWDDDSEYGGGSTVTSSAAIPPTIQYPAIGTKTTSIRKTTGRYLKMTSISIIIFKHKPLDFCLLYKFSQFIKNNNLMT